MLNLDGATPKNDTTTLTYNLPAPWGPDRGAAQIKIVARLASLLDPDYRHAVEKVERDMRLARVKAQKLTSDEERSDKDKIAGEAALAALNAMIYDKCVVSWSSNIQDGGKDVEPTRGKFLEIMSLKPLEFQEFVSRFRADVADRSLWEDEADAAVEAQEAKN